MPDQPNQLERKVGLDSDGLILQALKCARCGYSLIRQRPDGKCPECGEPVHKSIGLASSPYSESIVIAVFNQSLAIFFGSILLDGGNVLEVCLICAVAFWTGVAVAFWTGVAVIINRRPRTPTLADLIIIRWSFIPLVWVAYPAAMIVWHLRGLI